MKKKKPVQPGSLIIPCATVFISSACIMILEIVAGRLIAIYLGATLYVWTSVISVVLGGITIGNYIGGGIADRYPPKKTLGFLFGLSSATCVLIIILNNSIGEWTLLWQFPWPLRVLTHVTLIFLLPSALLGTISPVVAKIALDSGHPRGSTIGKIYAWGAAGSIVGTLLAGFFLISVFGTIAIIWIIAAILCAAGIFYWFKSWVLNAWAGVFVLLLLSGVVETSWAAGIGVSLGLRREPDSRILYEDESTYCYIAVTQLSKNPDIRQFRQDDLESHSQINMADITDLQFTYTRLFAAITHLAHPGDTPLTALSIGGGGYVFPRYIMAHYPGSRVDVAEIDPRVTKAAMDAFGLSEDTQINTINTDARHYVNRLLEEKKSRGTATTYNFIYGDAFGDSLIPFQLVTKEYHEKLKKILTENGVYAINLLDVYTSGKFLGAVVNTLGETFSHVRVVSTYEPAFTGRNFVVIASNREIPVETIRKDSLLTDINLWVLNQEEQERLIQKAKGIQLTDHHAPVEQLISPLSMVRTKIPYTNKLLDKGDRLRSEKQWGEALAAYEQVLKFCTEASMIAYSKMSNVYADIQDWDGVIMTGKKAIEYNNNAPVKMSDSLLHYTVGLLLIRQGYEEDGIWYMEEAIRGFTENIQRDLISPGLYAHLGNSYAYTGDFKQAAKNFQIELRKNKTDTETRMNLVAALMTMQQYDKAKDVLYEGIQVLEEANLPGDLGKVQEFLDNFEEKKAEYADRKR